MIRLTDLLQESVMAPENRISLGRIHINLEKILPELTKAQSNKLTKLFEEVSLVSMQLNGKPYTKFNHQEWIAELAMLDAKINDLREEVMKISKKKETLNCSPLIKALDEALGY